MDFSIDCVYVKQYNSNDSKRFVECFLVCNLSIFHVYFLIIFPHEYIIILKYIFLIDSVLVINLSNVQILYNVWQWQHMLHARPQFNLKHNLEESWEKMRAWMIEKSKVRVKWNVIKNNIYMQMLHLCSIGGHHCTNFPYFISISILNGKILTDNRWSTVSLVCFNGHTKIYIN